MVQKGNERIRLDKRQGTFVLGGMRSEILFWAEQGHVFRQSVGTFKRETT